MPAPEASVVLTAVNKGKQAFADFGRDLKGIETGIAGSSAAFERATGRVTKWGAALVAAGATAFFVKAVRESKEFGEALSEVSAITGAFGKDLAFISAEAQRFGRTTTLSASDAAKGFQLIAAAKPDLLENARALSQVTGEAIKLSEAAGIEMSEAANTLGQAMNQFGAESDQASRFINVLAAGARLGASEINDTSEALLIAGVQAKAAGISFEQTNATIQLLAASGLKGSDAGTALRNVFLRLQTQSETQFNPAIVGLTQALTNLGAANLSVTDRVEIFGERALSAADILIAQAGSVDKLTESLTGTTDAYDQARIRTDNLSGDVTALKNAFEGLAIQVGGGTEPILRQMTQAATDSLLAFTDMRGATGAANDEMANFGDLVEGAANSVVFLTGFVNQSGDAIGAFAAKVGAVLRADADRLKALFTGNFGELDDINRRVLAEVDAINDAREESLVFINDEIIGFRTSLAERRAQREEEYKLFQQRREEAAAAAAEASAALAGGKLITPTIVTPEADVKALDAIASLEHRLEELDLKRIERDIANRERELAERERFIEGLNTDLLAIQDHLGHREAVETAAYLSRQEMVQLNFENELVTDQTRKQLFADLALRHEETLTQIHIAGWNERDHFVKLSTKNQAKMIFGHLQEVTAGVANNNRTMFNLNKAAAIGNAIINTHEGITQMLKLPMPLNFIMAAVVAAAGAAQIMAIKSTPFGGGTTPSLANTPTVNNQPVAPAIPPGQEGAAQQPVLIVITQNGSIVDPRLREEIIGTVREGLENNDELLFGDNSRQMAQIKQALRRG